MDPPQSTNYQKAYKRFANWVEARQKRLDAHCHCEPPPNGAGLWNHVIEYHRKFHFEVENHGRKLNLELKRLLKSDDDEEAWQEHRQLESKWHKLWLDSLEQQVVVDRSRRCPKHKQAPSKPNKRRRPISYPNNAYDKLEWDYDGTLSLTGCHKEDGSQYDLDSVDEQTTKNLTEFGENYEQWLAKEDEIECPPVHSRPPSVEPSTIPEVAKAVVTNVSNHCNSDLIMLTTPAPIFSVPYKRQSPVWLLISFLIAIFVTFSAFYQEPHHLHKSYYHSQPPV